MSPTVDTHSQPVEQQYDLLLREGRGLLGWMTEAEAELTLVGRRSDVVATPKQKEMAKRARDAVHDRTPGVSQDDLVRAAPPGLSNHILTLRKTAAAFFNDGWRVALVDLESVVAVQPVVFTEAAEERVAAVDLEDQSALAELCLPTAPSPVTGAQFDPVRQAWMFSSRNPNLRVVGNFTGEVQPGIPGYGFVIQVSASHLQVASYQGRYMLRDGYHRACGLLKQGATQVPAFVRSFSSLSELGLPSGMLVQEAYLGDRPPLLPDYYNDEVAADVKVPAIQKFVVVQAMEFTPIG